MEYEHDIFEGSAVAPETRSLWLEMFRRYFDEPFNHDKREKFWDALWAGRFEEAIPLMLPVHVMMLTAMMVPADPESPYRH